jgi:phosphate/sulfate permease
MLIDYILMYVNSWIIIPILGLTIIYILIYYIYKKIKFVAEDEPDILKNQVNTQIPWGFCLSVSSILLIIVNNFMIY